MTKPTELTPAEARLLAAYRIMDRRAKESTWLYANRQAREHPATLDRPKLRLIQGGSHNNCREVRDKGHEITV